jgi:hypothetical protein
MKGLFSLVGLLLALGLAAVLVKRQMAAPHSAPATAAVSPSAPPDAAPALPTGTPQNQVDQVKQSVDQLMKARTVPDTP